MGTHFLMSYRFNKRTYSDFGLEKGESPDEYLNPKNKTVWIPCKLFDFGWGREIGFYRKPLPEYDTLFTLVIESQVFEDIYGASAIIMDKHSDELLVSCERILLENTDTGTLRRLIEVFHLDVGVNRSTVKGKSYSDVLHDYARWKAVSEKINQKIEENKKTEKRMKIAWRKRR